jgi:hypothetical protein
MVKFKMPDKVPEGDFFELAQRGQMTFSSNRYVFVCSIAYTVKVCSVFLSKTALCALQLSYGLPNCNNIVAKNFKINYYEICRK